MEMVTWCTARTGHWAVQQQMVVISYYPRNVTISSTFTPHSQHGQWTTIEITFKTLLGRNPFRFEETLGKVCGRKVVRVLKICKISSC